MHDIGKISLPDELLRKPTALNPEEIHEFKKHVRIGAKIIESMPSAEDELYLRHCRDIVLYHHERWDGTGYPSGLKGTDIPLSARIVALVDVCDSLIETRRHKPGFSRDEAFAIIRSASGSQFQPEMVKALLEVHSQLENV
jgi:putative two-component system response regulator